MSRKIVVGSRESRLAIIQTEKVMEHIRRSHPKIELEMMTMETTGDKRLDVTLDQIGGKGLFVKELDKALLDGRIDLAVHSLKDMPMDESKVIPIVRYSPREDVRDVLVLPKGVEEWDGRGIIGCSSFRRRIQAKRLFKEAEFRSVRGNVITRLEKLDRGEYDALILAAAGLKRLGLEYRISRYFSTDKNLHAAGQGTMAVQGRIDMNYDFLEKKNKEREQHKKQTNKERQTQRETERQRKRKRETDRQRKRQTEREREKQTERERERNRKGGRERERQTDRRTGREGE